MEQALQRIHCLAGFLFTCFSMNSTMSLFYGLYRVYIIRPILIQSKETKQGDMPEYCLVLGTRKLFQPLFYHFKKRIPREIMSWLLLVLLLSSTVVDVSADVGHENKRLPSAVVVGTVYCDTCFQQGFSKTSHFLSGALVAVECNDRPSGQTFRQEVKTNKQGEFRVNLPFSVGKHVRKIKSCLVELISSNRPYCSVAASASSALLHLQSPRQGTHIFSAGFFTFKPSKQPNLCNEKPSVEVNSNKALIPPNYDPTFPPPLQDPPTKTPAGLYLPLPFLPNLPPLPLLPPLLKPPPLPKKTTRGRNLNSNLKSNPPPSNQKTVYPEFFFRPSTFRPPLLFPPIPNQPPSFLPTNPLQPPPAPLIPLPPILGLTPPQQPALTFPFPPSTPFPGIPPASSSSSSSSPKVTSSP